MTRKYQIKSCPFCGNHPQVVKTEKCEMINGLERVFWLTGIHCNHCSYGLTTYVNDRSDIIQALIKKIEHWNTRIKK